MIQGDIHMKKTFKILCLVLALVISAAMFTGCSKDKEKEPAKDLPKVPEALEEARDDAMTLASVFVHDNEGEWADRTSYLIQLNPNSIEETNYEYTQLLQTLTEFKEENADIENLYILFKDDDGIYHRALTTEKKGDWMKEEELSADIKESLKSGLITSAKSGHDNIWPVYAPLYGTEGQIKCYLGLEYSFDLKDYPEWDKDSEKWHGIE